jgi:hypothetical protein
MLAAQIGNQRCRNQPHVAAVVAKKKEYVRGMINLIGVAIVWIISHNCRTLAHSEIHSFLMIKFSS